MIYSIHSNVDMVNVMLKSMIVSIVLMVVCTTCWVYIAHGAGIDEPVITIISFFIGFGSAITGLTICDGE